MPVTRVTNNSLAANAALNNLNAGASIAFTKPVVIPSLSGAAFGTGVTGALAVNVGSAGSFITNGGAAGTPSSITLTNATGLPISTGVSGLGSGIATFLATPTSANLAAAVTDETGTGSLVLANSPTLTSPSIAGTAQFTGTSRPTSAATGSPAATDLITRNDLSSLFDTFRLSRSFIEVKNMALTFTAGSGSSTITQAGSSPEQQRYATGATTGSFAAGHSAGNSNQPHPCPVAGINQTAINWGLRQRIFWKFSVRNFAGCDCRLYWGGFVNTAGTGDSTVRCVGIKITGSSLFLQTHNGTAMTTSAALFTVANDIVYDMWIDCDGLGNASIYNGDTLLGTIGGLATNIQTFNAYFIDRVDNNATTSNAILLVHKRAILTGSLY